MMLGLKRRFISKFLQSTKLKLQGDLQKTQQQIMADCISFRRVTRNTPCNGSLEILGFNPDLLKHPSFDFVWDDSTNIELSKRLDILRFHDTPNVLAEAVLTDIHEQAENYGINHALEFKKYFNGKSFVNIPKNENVVVEFSNQAIARPFHVAHLRSIMIGRFITNISKLFNKNVTFVNHFNDWTQMMGLMVSKRHGYPYKYKEDEIKYLVDAFEKMGEKDVRGINKGSKIYSQTLTFMNSLEQGDKKALEVWQKCRDVCVNGHEKMYQRLGIKFDAITADSEYTEKEKQIISMAKEKNLLQVDEETGAHYIDVACGNESLISVYLVNSDSLSYKARDITVAVDRFNTYSADRIIYVKDVPKGNFYFLHRIVKMLRSYQPGRIELARTELVNNVELHTPLSDILDGFMHSKNAIMLSHYLWEDGESLDDISEKLSISQFAVQNLKKRRYKKCYYYRQYRLSETFGGLEGADLQYAHAGLCRLIKLYNDDYSFKTIDFNLLSEDCAIRLIQHLARYPEILLRSYMELESCYLVHYLITLVKLKQVASNELLVLNQPKEIRDARLTLFRCTRQVLANGMNILGIQPLGKI